MSSGANSEPCTRRQDREEAVTFNKRFGADQGAIDHIFVEQKARASLRPVACDVIFRSVEPDGVWASDHFGVVAKLAVGK